MLGPEGELLQTSLDFLQHNKAFFIIFFDGTTHESVLVSYEQLIVQNVSPVNLLLKLGSFLISATPCYI